MSDHHKIADWMMPSIEEVRNRRETKGCGLEIAKDQLIHARIMQRMPVIIESQNFTELGDVVIYLLEKNKPSTY